MVTMLWDTYSRNRCLPRLLTSTSQCRLLPPTGLVYTLQVEQIIVSRSEANWTNYDGHGQPRAGGWGVVHVVGVWSVLFPFHSQLSFPNRSCTCTVKWSEFPAHDDWRTHRIAKQCHWKSSWKPLKHNIMFNDKKIEASGPSPGGSYDSKTKPDCSVLSFNTLHIATVANQIWTQLRPRYIRYSFPSLSTVKLENVSSLS